MCAIVNHQNNNTTTTKEKQMATKYHLIDNQTKRLIKVFNNRAAASRKADKLDLEYGAIRYNVRPIFDDK